MSKLSKLLFPLNLLGCPLLAMAGIGCLLFCKGKNHRRLTWAAGVFLTALVLFFGGSVLLGFFRLTWRNAPSGILCGVLLVSGWVGIVLAMVCALPMEWRNVPSVLQGAAKVGMVFFAGLILVESLWFGPLLLAFAYGGGERTVEYQGQTLVEVDDGFLDPWYRYYAYHGPLVRGIERIYEGPDHITDDTG